MKYKLSKLIIGLAAVCAFSGQAVAASYSLPVNSNGDGTYSAYFGSFLDNSEPTLGGNLSASNLSDVFSFSLSPISSGPISISASTSSAALTGLSFSIYDVTTSTPVATSSNGPDGSGNTIAYLNTSPVLGPDNFTLTVSAGPLTGKQGGVYNGSFTISPVPEPTEGALLLSGLGLFGFIAARRGRNEA